MNYNLPLLRKERDWVAEQLAKPWEESELYMDSWSQVGWLSKTCGTTYCVAGHIAATTTENIKWDGGSSVQMEDGHYEDIARWAADQLGLQGGDRGALFFGTEEVVLQVLDDLISRAEQQERDAA